MNTRSQFSKGLPADTTKHVGAADGASPKAHASLRRIESVSNPEWKALRKALAQGRALDDRYWIAETPRLLDEAMRSGCQVLRVYATSRQVASQRPRYSHSEQTEWVEVSQRAMEAAASTESSQGLFAVVRRPAGNDAASRQQFWRAQQLVVVLDQVQDPGNAGAIVRSAEAFGATGLIFMQGTASPDSPKLLRASAGSLFRVPFLQGLTADELLHAPMELNVYAAQPEAPESLEHLPLHFPAALVIGNEGAGICSEIEERAIGFRIPTHRVESLNAAVSAGIALYLFRRAYLQQNGGTKP